MKQLRLLVVLVILSVPALVFAGERTKLNGAELNKLYFSSLNFFAGIWVQYGSTLGDAWLETTYPNGTVELQWNSGIHSGRAKGRLRVAGDRICVTWENKRLPGFLREFEDKNCLEIYKIGDQKYENWLNGQNRGWFIWLK